MASAHGLPCDRSPAGGGRVAFTVHTGFFLFINLRVTDGRNGKNSAAHDRPRRPLDRCGRKRRRSRYDTHSVHYCEPDNTSMSPPIVFKDVAPVVPVRDLQAALERYRQLGFEVRAYGHGTGYGYAQRGAVSIHLSAISTFQMLMPSERNGPVAESRVVSVSLATLITECESSDSWIRTAPCIEWVRSCLKGPT